MDIKTAWNDSKERAQFWVHTCWEIRMCRVTSSLIEYPDNLLIWKPQNKYCLPSLAAAPGKPIWSQAQPIGRKITIVLNFLCIFAVKIHLYKIHFVKQTITVLISFISKNQIVLKISHYCNTYILIAIILQILYYGYLFSLNLTDKTLTHIRASFSFSKQELFKLIFLSLILHLMCHRTCQKTKTLPIW